MSKCLPQKPLQLIHKIDYFWKTLYILDGCDGKMLCRTRTKVLLKRVQFEISLFNYISLSEQRHIDTQITMPVATTIYVVQFRDVNCRC